MTSCYTVCTFALLESIQLLSCSVPDLRSFANGGRVFLVSAGRAQN